MSDIKRIAGKYYDFAPKNTSFITTAKELKTLGIKNYYFMLSINDPRLADIDPFKKNITQGEIEALQYEFAHNMWSFIRMVVRLRTQAGVVPYGLHRGLAAALWCFDHHYDNCLCEPRQTYKTTGTLGGPLLWAFQLSENLRMHFFGKETKNTKKNLADLRDDITLLPEWLQFSKYIDYDGKVRKARRSTEKLENNLWHNELYIYPKPANLPHAQGLGRGGSGNILYFDEIEHMPFFGEVMGNSGPLFKTASENAAKVGMPYCRMFSCTPGNLDTREGIQALPIIKSMIPWSESIYDMTKEQLDDYRNTFIDEYHKRPDTDNTREVLDVFYIEYQYYQVRKDYNWVKEQYKIIGDKFTVRREILLQRLRGSNASPLDPEDIEYLISHMKKSEKDIIINSKWKFNLYDHGQGTVNGKLKDLDENIPYLVGVDPAAGGGGDNFAVTIINPYNLRIAAEFKSPYISGPQAVRMLVTLVKDYIPRAVISIEKNSMGITLIQYIIEETSIGGNLYYSDKAADQQIEDLTSENPNDYKLKDMANQYKKYCTYLTGKVRDLMIEILFKHIAECKQILNTEYLVDDICKLVRKNGKVQALQGEHDDCLFSYLHAMFIFYYGDNLLDFGIDNTINPVISPVEIEPEKINPYDGLFIDHEQRTFDDIAMDDAAMSEIRTKELVSKFNWIHDDVYSDLNVSTISNDNTISTYFFDQINGLL